MSTIEQSVEVQVPVRAAYDQWTQFEDFPRFMEGVEQITQTDDTHNRWVTQIGGVRREFDAEITEQTPDQRIAWRTEDGPHQAGAVTFHRVDEGATRVMLQMDFDPDGLAEQVGDKLGLVEHRVKADLERFKEFIEARGGQETGAWRGEVDQRATS